MNKKNNDIQLQSTRIVMDALQRGGINVVPVTDEFAQRFIREHERADKAQFHIVGQHMLYSNARMALESIGQQKATASQWLGMLRNKGGIKEGEDRWTGLSAWLMEKPDRVLDKRELQEYLNAHAINLHEEYFNEIQNTGHFKELQHELDALAEAVDGNYRQAVNAYDEFLDRMKEQYGDEYEYDMTAEESQEEEDLLEERDRWNTWERSAHDIAFEQMEEKYGSEFSESFYVHGDSLDVYSEADARRFITDWTIDELHKECTTEALDNYYELAFWVEDIESWNKKDLIHFGEVGQGRCIGWVRFGDTVEKRPLSEAEIQRRLDAMPGLEAWTKAPEAGLDKADLYYPPGYNPGEPYSYIMQRKGDRTAEYVPYKGSPTCCHSLRDAVQMYNRLNVEREERVRVLVIDEIQSQRHQKGRKEGYRLKPQEKEAVHREYAAAMDEEFKYRMSLKEKYGTSRYDEQADEAERGKLQEFKTRARDYFHFLLEESKLAERAPFEKNWHELCMKRMLRYAAEKGYDKLAWTTGEQQNIRYDTTVYINSIHRGADDPGGRYYHLDLKGGTDTDIHVDEKGYVVHSNIGWKGRELSEIMGKNMAERMMAMQPKTTLRGDELEVKKNKMDIFYDQKLPNFLNSYGKKWGIKVMPLEMTRISRDNNYVDEPLVMHSVDITPAMKESVMQGQPMFMKDRKGQVYGWTLDGTVYLTPRGMNAETAIHEYTHLWAEIMRQKDKPAWNHIKSLLRDTPVWQQILRDRNYRNLRGDEDRIASEALARVSGHDNTAKLEQVLHQVTSRDRSLRGLEQIKQALGKFWSWVGKHVFNIRQARNLSDVTDRILGDLLRGTRPERQRPEHNGRVTDIQLRMFGQHPNRIPRLRCRIDGEQQMYADITRKEAETLQNEKNPDRREQLQQQLIRKYFADRLTPDRLQGIRR